MRILKFTLKGGKIARVEIIGDPARLREFDLSLLPPRTVKNGLPAPPPHPGDPPPPREDYPIFFATSRRSGRDNSGRYDYLKDGNGQVVMAPKRVLAHDEQGQPIEVTQDRPVLDTDLDGILFGDMPWSTDAVASTTLGRIGQLGWSVHVGQLLHDMDEPQDLGHLPVLLKNFRRDCKKSPDCATNDCHLSSHEDSSCTNWYRIITASNLAAAAI